MKHLLMIALCTFSGAAYAAPEECPDLSGRYSCSAAADEEQNPLFKLDIKLSLKNNPSYAFTYFFAEGISQQWVIADEQLHDGYAGGPSYRASCSENKLVVKYLVAQKVTDIRIYTKGKDGFMIDTLAGDRNLCKIALP